MTNQQAGLFILILALIMVIAAVGIRLWDKNRKKRYSQTTTGRIISHKWRCLNHVSIPYAVVEYCVNNQIYQCFQSYTMVYTNTIKHAQYDWEIDDQYCLHRYLTSRCEKHINPITDWFPINSTMTVHYMPQKPQKAYCGGLPSMKLFCIIVGVCGILLGLFGILLTTVLA